MFSNGKKKSIALNYNVFKKNMIYLQIYKNNSFINKIVMLEFSQINEKKSINKQKNQNHNA
jgi:hypothetical protein